MIGQTISHFHILEKIGEGGMGVVYRAEDTNLKRNVALKFLPRGLEAHEPEQARFLQEAQAPSAINHSNLCTIYEISQHEDQQFIVMEYVDRKILRQLIPIQKTQMAIDYAIQIGEALQEAHQHGIVHRDVKTSSHAIRLSVFDLRGSTIATTAMIYPIFGFDLSIQEVGTGDGSDELSKKLFNEGKISRYVDFKYFGEYKKKIMYWDGEGWSNSIVHKDRQLEMPR